MNSNGAWWIWSKSNPAWNKAGRCVIGAISTPKELGKEFGHLCIKYGGRVPKDLRMGTYIDNRGAKEVNPAKVVQQGRR